MKNFRLCARWLWLLRIRKLTEEEFFLKVDEGIADVEAGKYLISESVEAELAAEFGLANK